jgi:hypothetical protein
MVLSVTMHAEESTSKFFSSAFFSLFFFPDRSRVRKLQDTLAYAPEYLAQFLVLEPYFSMRRVSRFK